MTNAPFNEIEHYNDVKTHNLYFYNRANGMDHDSVMTLIKATSRDHSRTPMQWNASGHAGFSTALPWIGVNPNYDWLNVEAQQQDPRSILSFYKQMIWMRKHMDVLVYGSYELVELGHESVYAYLREDENDKVLVVSNLGQHACLWDEPEDANLLLANYSHIEPQQLLPYEARVYKLAK